MCIIHGVSQANRAAKNLTTSNKDKRRRNRSSITQRTYERRRYIDKSCRCTSTAPRNDAIRSIQKCRNSFELVCLIRTSKNISFASSHASKTLLEKIRQLASTMNIRNVSGLLNCLSKESIPYETRKPYHHLMNFLAEFSMNKMDDCTGKELSIILNALAKKGIKNNKLFSKIAAKAISIIDTYNSQDLAITANAYAKMRQYHPKLFDEIATASIPIISTFKARNLANTANAFAKMNHHHPLLFDEIAKASIPIIGKFNAQNLANTANAFAKMNHHHPRLFDQIATASISMINEFNAQGLANNASAFAKARLTRKTTNQLFSCISKRMMTDSLASNWSQQSLVEVAYAFMKLGYSDEKLVDKIGKEIISRKQIELDARQLGNLAACFNRYETSTSFHVLKMVYSNICALKIDQIGLQCVADVSSAMWMAQRLKVLSPEMLNSVVALGITKADESRVEDVRDILIGLSLVDLPQNIREKSLNTYKPYVKQYFKDISGRNRSKICKMYERSGIRL